jgi:hypothetical protein
MKKLNFKPRKFNVKPRKLNCTWTWTHQTAVVLSNSLNSNMEQELIRGLLEELEREKLEIEEREKIDKLKKKIDRINKELF